MSFRKISAACNGSIVAAYFVEGAADPVHDWRRDPGRQPDADGERLTNYYLGRDGRASYNTGMSRQMADVLGIDRHVAPTTATLAAVFEGKRADTKEAWSKANRKISAYDLTLAPHKSVTLIAEFAQSKAESAAIWHAMQQANDATMSYVADVMGQARRGKGGKAGAQKGEVAWTSYRHRTSRPTVSLHDALKNTTYIAETPTGGDPHMHIHNTLYNLVVTPGGHVGSLDTKQLQSRVLEFGAYFQARLADELRRLGIETRYDAKEEAVVVAGVPQHVSEAFSSRTAEITRQARAYAKAHGHDWETMRVEHKNRMLKAASLAHRQKKNESADDVASWQERAPCGLDLQLGL